MTLPEFMEQPSLQQGLDLVLAGVQRLGRFLQRTEHVAHLRLPGRPLSGLRHVVTTRVHSMPCGFFGDFATRL
jgi:hypothetical protein